MDRPLTVEYAKEVANAFIQTYYQNFDNGPRENLSNLYVPDNETSQMSFEGNLIRGQQAIVAKLKVRKKERKKETIPFSLLIKFFHHQHSQLDYNSKRAFHFKK